MNNTKTDKDEEYLERIRLREVGELNAPRRYRGFRSSENDEELGHAGNNERWIKLWRKLAR